MKESIGQQYNNKLKEINDLKEDIEEIIKSCINELEKAKSLIEFNQKYQTHFNGTEKKVISCEIKELKDMDDQKFQDLCKINLKYLEELGIYGGKSTITNIDSLSEALFLNLLELSINGKIENINKLSKMPFKNLKILDLSENDINNIDILGEAPFYHLTKLIFEGNKICNIDILSKAPFPDLT